MGAFHACLAFLSVIGQRFGDAGLTDLTIESSVVGSSAVNGVVSGKHYNRAVRAHKVVAEAMYHILWEKFESSLSMRSCDIAEELLSKIRAMRQSNFNPALFLTLCDSAEFREIKELFIKWRQFLKSPVSLLWLSYVDMVFLLLNFVRSSRTGDWLLHLSCMRQMLPWFFAYDRINYSRYLSLYWSEMKALPTSHPTVHEKFIEGEFCVQRSEMQFSQVPVDLTIEQTINRDSKTSGGIIGFSRKPGAVQRWIISAHYRAEMQKNWKWPDLTRSPEVFTKIVELVA